eukprot:4784077-Prymnesium_polylepis.1
MRVRKLSSKCYSTQCGMAHVFGRISPPFVPTVRYSFRSFTCRPGMRPESLPRAAMDFRSFIPSLGRWGRFFAA